MVLRLELTKVPKEGGVVAALHARARMFEQRVHLLVPRELADRELAREEHGLPGVARERLD